MCAAGALLLCAGESIEDMHDTACLRESTSAELCTLSQSWLSGYQDWQLMHVMIALHNKAG